MAQEEIKTLQLQYEELYGKKAYHGWTEEQLKEKISEKMSGEKVKEINKNVFKGVEIKPKKNYSFRILTVESPRIIIPRQMETWDDETESERIIRYCETESSPYLDEQKENSRISSTMIAFDNGTLEISGMKSSLIKYLLASDFIAGKGDTKPENQAFRNLFELVDNQKETKSELQKEDELDAAIAVVKGATVQQLKDYLSSVYNISIGGMTDEDITLTARRKAKANPVEFVKGFNNPLHKLKADIRNLFVKGELAELGGVVRWVKTNTTAITLDKKESSIEEALAKWVLLGSKEAKSFKELLDNKL